MEEPVQHVSSVPPSWINADLIIGTRFHLSFIKIVHGYNILKDKTGIIVHFASIIHIITIIRVNTFWGLFCVHSNERKMSALRGIRPWTYEL